LDGRPPPAQDVAVHTRELGHGGPSVSAIGFGAMVLTGLYGAVDTDQGLATLRHALDAGITLVDTADAYGPANEQLVGRAVAERPRDEVVVATKFGWVLDAETDGRVVPSGWDLPEGQRANGTPAFARRAIDRSLANLGLDHVDLWYLHVPDPGTPIEETVGAMAELVAAGKVRHLGVCNASEEEVRRAHAVHPLAAVQNEYSLWTRDAEAGVLPACRELGIGFVPWAPLGSGFLTGTVAQVADGDFRRRHPRFSEENLRRNTDRFAPVRGIAEELGISPAQLALAWCLHQGDRVVPIPGTRTPGHVDDNAAAAGVVLSDDVLARLDAAAPAGAAAGAAFMGSGA
jgi:aryl-alcohol dehydrogenase-like predicted oxidoreductase